MFEFIFKNQNGIYGFIKRQELLEMFSVFFPANISFIF